MRQQRMSSRLEWRRQMRRTMAKNKVYVAACWYGLVVGVIVSLVLLSELLRVTVWTLLR